MHPVAAGSLVFFTSAAVLVLEILAGRLLAPYVGVTLETYTGIIGIVLAGISVGTWYGGKLADRVAPRRLLPPLLVLGGATALASVPLIRILGALDLGHGPAAIVTLSLFGFFVPSAVLSAVNPTVVKLQLRDLQQSGSVVGRLSALGTAGAIVGTFTTGFLLVAALPTRPIVLGVGLALIAVGVTLWLTVRGAERGRFPWVSSAVAILSVGGAFGLSEPCMMESAYFCARVVVDPERPTGRKLVLDRVPHTYVDLADPTHLGFTYVQALSDVLATVAPERAPIRALHVGGGGFSLPRYIEATRPGSFNRVLELDGTLLDIAREHLGLVVTPNLEVRIGDARMLIRPEPTDAYDVVLGDAFGGQAVPWHLTTVEFLREVDRVLKPDGVYAMNLIDYPPLAFVSAELNTMREVFPHVALLAPRERLDKQRGGNFVIVASRRPIPAEQIVSRNRSRGDDDHALHTAAQLTAFAADARVLTDDYAPVDQLLQRGLP